MKNKWQVQVTTHFAQMLSMVRTILLQYAAMSTSHGITQNVKKM